MEIPYSEKLSWSILVAVTIFVAMRWALNRPARAVTQEAPFATEQLPESEPTGYGKEFRVQGVPLNWSPGQLKHFLEGRDICTTAVVQSLATEYHGRTQTGTVCFQITPTPLRNIGGGDKKRNWKIKVSDSVQNSSGREAQLVLDSDFFGMTTLFRPPAEDHKVDIVAVHGLGGHAFGSFKERGGDHMWLRDRLPYDLIAEDTKRPMARVLTYGYDSTIVGSNSTAGLLDFATSFHSTLLELELPRWTKPIVFVAHSLGGLVVKQALVSLSKSDEEPDRKLIEASYGIAFFGVPHQGMEINHILPMAGNGPNRQLIESISNIPSGTLANQQRDFHAALGGRDSSEVVCFYETELSPTAQEVAPGVYKMTGPLAVLVTKASATNCRYWEYGEQHMCAIGRSHSALVKLGPEDPDYGMVRPRLRGLTRRAAHFRLSAMSDERTRLAHRAREARDLLENSQFAPGAQLLQQVTDTERSISADDDARFQNLCTLQWAWWKAGDKRRAEEVAREALGISERTLGQCHPKTLHLMKCLADNLIHQGRRVDSGMLYKEMEERQSFKLGDAIDRSQKA